MVRIHSAALFSCPLVLATIRLAKVSGFRTLTANEPKSGISPLKTVTMISVEPPLDVGETLLQCQTNSPKSSNSLAFLRAYLIRSKRQIASDKRTEDCRHLSTPPSLLLIVDTSAAESLPV